MKKETLLSFIILAIALATALWYMLSLRPGLSEVYSGSANGWLQLMIDKIYPRFTVEKERFPLHFFLNKADQVIMRFSLVSTIAALLLFLKGKSQKLKTAWNNYLYSATSVANVSMIRIFFSLALLWIYKDVWWDLMSHYELKIFYKPVLIYKLLHIGYPNPFWITILCIILLFSCLLTIINFRPPVSSFIAVTTFIVIEGFLNSFEKMDHGDATITYCALIFPFLMIDHEKAFLTNSESQNKWALTFITFMLCLAYMQSGLEKVLMGGFSWISPETLRNYILLHQASWGLALVDNNILLSLLSFAAIAFQLGFIFILAGRYKYFFLTAGVLFHAGVYLLLDVGWYINSWVLCYLFFIDWKNLTLKVSRKMPFLSGILIPGKE
jgi:hypothetical protein